MKTIPALLDAVETDHLWLAEHSDDIRLRAPVLSLDSDGTPIVYVSAWGGPKRRQEAESALKLFKALIEKGLEVASDDDLPAVDVARLEADIARLEGERDGLKASVDDLKEELASVEMTADQADRYAAALDEIMTVTSAKKAKEIAAGVRG